jgi:hypothetical protein
MLDSECEDPANGRLGNPSHWHPPRAIDSKPPHGFSPCGHGVPPCGTPVQTTYKPSVVLFKNLQEKSFLQKETKGTEELRAASSTDHSMI